MCVWSSKEPSHLIGAFKYPQHMFWLRNNKNNFPLRILIWRMDMRSRLTVRLYNNTLSNAFKSMGSHLCTKIIFLGIFACGALAASICVGIVIPSTWFVYLYNILLAQRSWLWEQNSSTRQFTDSKLKLHSL